MTSRELYEKALEKGARGTAIAAMRRASNAALEVVESAKQVRGVLSPWRKGQLVVFHIGRSGSSVLKHCLHQHSQMYCGGEIYNDVQSFFYDPIRVFKKERRKAGRCYFICQVKPYHLEKSAYTVPSYIEALRRQGGHFVLLERKNVLRKLVSSTIAKSGRYTYHISSADKRKKVAAHIDVDRIGDRTKRPLLDQINQYVGEYETVRESIEGDHALELTYEDDIYESPLKAYRKIVDFLGCSYEEVEIKRKKTNPFPVRELVSNFEEVETCLKGTEHEWMLYA